jgi:hypothetical protein
MQLSFSGAINENARTCTGGPGVAVRLEVDAIDESIA